MDESRPLKIDLLAYIRSLDPRRYKSADVLQFNDDAALWLERSIALKADIGIQCAKFPKYLAAKCSLRDLQLANDVEPDISGWVFISGPLLARCAFRKSAVQELRWGVVYEGESFHFIDGTSQSVRHEPEKHDDKTLILGAWAVGRGSGQTVDVANVEYSEMPLELSRGTPGRIIEKVIRGLLERITVSSPVVRAIRFNADYLAGTEQSHEYLFPSFPTFGDEPCPACGNGKELAT